jgi:hypothetical protein
MSRDFGKIIPRFWTGNTGRIIHKDCPEATVVAAYLLTGPHANMLGLYYLPRLYLAHESGLGFDGASKGLGRAIEAGFCQYDDPTEMVFVFEMARIQIAEHLEPKDKRVSWVQRVYDALPENPFLPIFYERYAAPFHMTQMRGEKAQTQSPIEGASKPLRCQEQEQEQEPETEQETKAKTVAPTNGARLTLCEPEEPWSVIRRSTPTEKQVDQLYKLYPRKIAPFDAKKAIRKAVGRVMGGDADHPALMSLEEALDFLAERTRLFADCVRGRDRKYVPHPTTWFHGDRYWDDPKEWRVDEGAGNKKTNGGFHHDGDDSRYEKGADLVYRNE